MIITLLSLGCRGSESDQPPIHLNPNMDMQPKSLPQSESKFFVDGSAMRMPPEGVVARGKSVVEKPMHFTEQQLEYGKERFDIFCSRCHGLDGKGKGIVIEKGFLPPPDFHSDKVKKFSDEYIYNVITNGVRNMPSHAAQIPPKDRWLIVNHVRELQNSPAADQSQEVAGGEKSGL